MKVNIGGQKGRRKGPFKDWTIVDTREGAEIRVDIMEKPLPLSDSSVDAIYTSHTLEHIFPDKLPFVLHECRRVLKSGCPIRIVVPDIEKALKAYAKGDFVYLGDGKNPARMPWLPNKPICQLASWFFTYKLHASGSRLTGGHVMVFNNDLLRYYVKQAGFREISNYSYGKGSKIFRKCDFARYKSCSIYLEAIK